MNKLLTSMLLLTGLYSCQTGGDGSTTEVAALDGKQLMEDRCYACHNTQGTDNMLAPPMFRVKDHYWYDEVTEAEFIESIVEWVNNPTEENSVMPGALRKFGLMPKQKFDEAEVRAIAKYMFNNEI